MEEASDNDNNIPDICVPGVLGCIARHLTVSEVAWGLRLTCKAAVEELHTYTHVKLSQPSPPDAFKARWATRDVMRELTIAKRKRLLCLAAASGSLTNLQAAIRAAGLAPFDELPAAAVAAGHLHVLQWLEEEGWPLRWLLAAAASGGQKAMCEWLLEHGHVDNGKMSASSAAARNGHPVLADWLRQHGNTYNVGLHKNAAYGCDLPAVQHLCQGKPPKAELSDMLAAAACSPTKDWQVKFTWLESQGQGDARTNHKVCRKAAGCSDAVDRLAWLRQRGYPLGTAAVEKAAKAGNAAAVRYLLKEISERLDENSKCFVVAAAAKRGHLAVLQAMHSLGYCEDTEAVAIIAVENGHLDVLDWLAEACGYIPPTGMLMFYGTSKTANVEMMAWLRARGCDWDYPLIDAAAESGCEVAVEWLVENGCPLQDGISSNGLPYVMAGKAGDLAMLRCLHRVGCPWGNAGEVPHRIARRIFYECYEVKAATMRHVLRCLAEEGCPGVPCITGDVAMARYLRQIDCGWTYHDAPKEVALALKDECTADVVVTHAGFEEPHLWAAESGSV